SCSLLIETPARFKESRNSSKDSLLSDPICLSIFYVVMNTMEPITPRGDVRLTNQTGNRQQEFLPATMRVFGEY
ncbi:MAG TPA: hypothetical protein VFW68_09855, partial [Rhodocyclaceae bacterium]|nr:hypothetical protein [Rhodocyclaceae bacterium]